MELKDIKRLQADVSDARLEVETAERDHKSALADVKATLNQIKANQRDLTALNGAIISRRNATAYQLEMKAHWQSVVSRDSHRVTVFFRDLKKPDGYEAALAMVNKITLSDTGFKEQAISEILAPFKTFHDNLVNMQKLRDGLNEAKKQLDRFNALTFQSKVGETKDLRTQSTLLKHKETLENMLANDRAYLSLKHKHLQAAIGRYETLATRYKLAQDALASDPVLADDYMRQLDNIARARAGQAKKRKDAMLAEKARASARKITVWVKGSQNPLATDVHYKPSGCDYRKTGTVATTKGSKAQEPRGKITLPKVGAPKQYT